MTHNTRKEMMNGNTEADTLGHQIINLYEDEGINVANANEWLGLCKRLQGVIDLMECHAKDVLDAETKRIAASEVSKVSTECTRNDV